MVRRGDEDGVDIAVVQQLADVAVDGHVGAAVLEGLGFTVEVGAVHVAQRDNPCSRDLAQRVDELVPPPSDAADRGDISQTHDADADLGVGPAPLRGRIAAEGKAWQPQCGCRGDRTLQELAACCSLHGLVPDLRWAVAWPKGTVPFSRRFGHFAAVSSLAPRELGQSPVNGYKIISRDPSVNAGPGIGAPTGRAYATLLGWAKE